jgi:hypothetical protein
MTVNVVTDIVVDRPFSAVAAFTADPPNAPSWSCRWNRLPPYVAADLQVRGLPFDTAGV